jgi:CRP/FNR family transcriptional regulator, cyclic AMP receptor protein
VDTTVEARRQAVARALGASTVFGRLAPRRLEGLADSCGVRRYDKGEQVFRRGEPGTGMYLVGSGSVALSIGSADGGEVTLAVLRPPGTFGEMAVVDGGPRVATATARQPSAVVTIPGSEVLRLVDQEPSISRALLTSMAALVRQVDDQASDLVLVDLPGRVAKFLARAAASSTGSRTRDGSVRVDVGLNQSELARLVGGSRQQVNRVIVRLEAAGAIERSGSRIVAVRPALLAGPT